MTILPCKQNYSVICLKGMVFDYRSGSVT